MFAAAQIDSEEAGLGMNGKKTNTVVVVKQEGDKMKADIEIDNETLKQVSTFKDLGQTIASDGKIESEMKIKIAIAKNRFKEMYRLLTSRKISWN